MINLRGATFALVIPVAFIAACGDDDGTSPPTIAPVVRDDAYITAKNVTLTVAAPGLSANDDLNDGSIVAGTFATNEGGSVTVQAGGGFSYEPATDFVGADAFSYTAANASSSSDPAAVTIEVGELPVAADDRYVTPKNTLLIVSAPGLLANDELNDGSPDAGTFDTNEGGSVTIEADGGFSYEPPTGFDGLDSFTYTVTSSFGSSDPATVSIELPALPWTSLPPLPTALSRPAGAVVEGRFYVLGGEAPGGTRDGLVYAYDRNVGSWDTLVAMPTGVSNLCAVAIGQYIYVPGGYTGVDGSDALQRYDTEADNWTIIDTDPLPSAHFAGTCSAHAGRLFVFGGSPTGIAGTIAWMYDPAAPAGSRWNDLLAPLPEALHYLASVTVGNQIFVVGGNTTNSANVYAYEPASDDWTPYPALTAGRGGPAAWASGATLYVGGGGWSSYLTSVESYNTAAGTSGTWSSEADLTAGRRTGAYGSDPVMGWLYVAGGWNGAYLDAAEIGLLKAPSP